MQHLGVRSFGCCQLLLVDQRLGVFIRLIDCWVSSELSGKSALCWGPSDFVSEVDLFFNAECSEMRLVKWWAGSGSNHLTRVSVWWCQIVVLIAYSFCWVPSAFRFVAEVDFFAGQLFGDLPLALISQFVCHNCSVPGFTDGAGFRWGGCISCWVPKQHLVFVTMS